MRGLDERSGDLFSYVDLEERVDANFSGLLGPGGWPMGI